MKLPRLPARLSIVTLSTLVASTMIGACGNFALSSYKASSGVGGNDYATAEAASGTTSTGAGGGDFDAGSDYITPKDDSYGFLCGAGSCLPGSEAGDLSCKGTSSSSSTSSSTSGVGGSGAGGQGAGGQGAGGAAQTSGSSGSSGTPSGDIGCVLDMSSRGVTADCKYVGTSKENEPCSSTADCAASLGCVKTSGSGICRHYCCGKTGECEAGSYCFPELSFESGVNGPHIPVCLPASNCQLLSDSSCGAGETCTIVRQDPATSSCVIPGSGHRGDYCGGTLYCAAGFFCSDVQQACVKLCHTDSNDECDAPGYCQGGMQGFPSSIGVCAGY